eukprot:gene12237-8423_t
MSGLHLQSVAVEEVEDDDDFNGPMPARQGAPRGAEPTFRFIPLDHTVAFSPHTTSTTTSSDPMQRSPHVVITIPRSSTNEAVAAEFVVYDNLPHPRHDFPCCYLVPSACACCGGADRSSSSAPLHPLLEVQAQDPPEGFAQTFFVGEDAVVPQNDSLVATPVDLHFILLRVVMESWEAMSGAAGSGGAQPSCFCAVEDFIPGLRAAVTEARGSAEFTCSSRPSNTASHATSPESRFGADTDTDQGAAREEEPPSRCRAEEIDTLYDDGEAFFQQLRQEQHTRGRGPLQKRERMPDKSSSSSSGWWGAWLRAATLPPASSSSSSSPAPNREREGTSHLLHVLSQLPLLLHDFCDVKYTEAGRGGGGGTSRAPDQAYQGYYRFSPLKAAVWVGRRVQRLARSATLWFSLQVPPREEGPTATSPPTADDPYADVLASSALALVSEYISAQTLNALREAAARATPEAVREACVDTAAGGMEVEVEALRRLLGSREDTTSTPGAVAQGTASSPPPLPSAPDPAGPGITKDGPRAAAPGTGLVSAKVRRLEKAGRPKGTPTLDSFFGRPAAAKKNLYRFILRRTLHCCTCPSDIWQHLSCCICYSLHNSSLSLSLIIIIIIIARLLLPLSLYRRRVKVRTAREVERKNFSLLLSRLPALPTHPHSPLSALTLQSKAVACG